MRHNFFSSWSLHSLTQKFSVPLFPYSFLVFLLIGFISFLFTYSLYCHKRYPQPTPSTNQLLTSLYHDASVITKRLNTWKCKISGTHKCSNHHFATKRSLDYCPFFCLSRKMGGKVKSEREKRERALKTLPRMKMTPRDVILPFYNNKSYRSCVCTCWAPKRGCMTWCYWATIRKWRRRGEISINHCALNKSVLWIRRWCD